MNFKLLNFNTKKFISVLCAITVLIASLPLSALLLTANAADGAIIDFQGEDAGDIVEGNNFFTIGGQDNADTKYFYANNATEDTVTLTVDGLQLKAGKKYTVDMDLYAKSMSKDADGKVFGIKIYGGSEASTETFVCNDNISIEEWTNFHFTFTAKEGSDKLDFSAFNSASALIEDFAITDEDGKKVDFDLKAACDAYGNASVFAYGTLTELSGGSMKPTGPSYKGDPNYVVYIDNSANDIQSGQIWFNLLGAPEMSLTPGKTYTLKFDNYTLNESFKGHCYIGIHNTGGGITGQNWWDTSDKLNEWATQSVNFTPTGDKALAYHTLHVGAGFKGYLDNFRVYDGDTEVATLTFDETNLGKTSGGATVVELPKEIAAKSYPAYKLTMDNGEIFRTSDTSCTNSITYSFDYYLVKGKVTAGSANVGNLDTELAAGVGSHTITGDSNTRSLKLTANENAVIYIWNVKIVADGTPKDFANRTDRTNCEFEEISFADIPGVNYEDIDDSGNESQDAEPNYAIYFDSSISNNFWVTLRDESHLELGMEQLSLPAGNTYTVEFDVYSLTLGHRVVFGATQATWSTSSAIGSSHQVWKEAPTKVEEWTHYSFNVTTSAEWKGVMFYVIQDTSAFKGYIDNLKIKNSTGAVVASFEPTATDLDKSSNCAKIINIGGSGQATKPAEDNYVMFVDTTNVSDNGSDNRNFWFNELGMASYYNKLQSGKTYTVSFDVYPIKMPTSNNLFHYRTSAGATSVTGKWWKPDLRLNEWQNTTSKITIDDSAKTGNHVLYVYGGFKGYIDNFKLLDENGQVVEGTATDFSGLTIKNADYENYIKIEKEKVNNNNNNIQPAKSNYAIYIDNSTNDIQSGQIWFNLLGAPQMSLTPGKTYTLKFDNYALTESFKGHCYVGVHNTGGGITGQNWWDTSDKLNEWATQSVNFTPTGDKALAYHTLHVGAGFKGYLDNFRVYDGDTEVAVLTFDETNEGKTSAGATVVKLPAKIDPEYVPSGNLSGLEIAILKGKAGKDGAAVNLGGAKSPLTLESNKTYKLIFKYYQANPTASGELNLFGVKFIEAALGKANNVKWFKKNNADGWTEVKVEFSTGTITNASSDWFQLVLNPNAWVFFDDFTVEETEVDNNKEISKITFDQKDDSIYPKLEVEDCVFEHSGDLGGSFKVVNATEYTNQDKNSNRQYTFKGIKMKSNTTYKISIDYYIDRPYEDYIAAFGYSRRNLGVGSDNYWAFIDNEKDTGWHNVTFTVTTGEVAPNANYFNLVCYDVDDKNEPRTIWFDNFTITEQYTVNTLVNDSTLGSATKTFGAQAGENVRVVANAFEGATFEGWYEYGDLVSTNKTYRINNIDDNHNLEARFSGKAKPGTVIVQGFEDYELGDVIYPYYEIVNDPKNALEGGQSLHVKGDKITANADHSIFFPVVTNKEYQMKEDYTYDVYIWIKPVNKAESHTYFAFLGANSFDQSDMLVSGNYWSIGVSSNIKPDGSKAVEEKDGWYRYLLGTVTKDHTDRNGFGFQVCKFHYQRQEGASIDDFYVDRVEVVERTPDFANLKYTEKFFNDVTNPNFEEPITDENWGPLTDGVTVEKVTDKEFDWQENYQLKFNAAASNGKEYVRVIPLSKAGKNYTFAAWTKLSKGSDITVGLYKNGNYEVFENVMNGETGRLALVDNGKWNRVNFSFNSGDSKEAYLVIKGTKGTLELDMVDIFIAERGYKVDPNTYGEQEIPYELTSPIAFPDKITTEEVLIEEGVEATNNKKYLIKREYVGPNVLWIVLGIVGGVVLAAGATILIIVLVKKRKKN